MMMRAARMYGYHEPLRLERIAAPDVGPEEVRVQVGGAGMCRTDFQLIDGYFKAGLSLEFPITPGHEVAGWVEGMGKNVPRAAGLAEGDQVVVDGGWGDGACRRQCHGGDQQVCVHGRWIGFGPAGGYQEYVAVDYRHLIKVPQKNGLSPDVLAPLTDAGVTPYRGHKKLRDAGALGAGRTVAVIGAGGLGVYAVQYAKILGGGAAVVVLARSDDKLTVGKGKRRRSRNQHARQGRGRRQQTIGRSDGPT